MINNSFKAALLNAVHDFDTDLYHLILVTNAYTPDQDAHTHRDDITNEVSGTGYTAGGAEIENMVVSQDNTNNRGVVDSDDVSWTAATITARRGVMCQINGGEASADPIVGDWDFGGDIASTGGTFLVAVNASGWLAIGDA